MRVNRRGWLAIVGLGAFVLANAWWLRGPILWSLACPLVADDPTPPGCYLWLRSDDGVFLEGAPSCKLPALVRAKTPDGKILLVDSRPSRLAQFGVLPAFARAARDDLKARGVPDSAITVLPGEQRGLEAELAVLKRFLAAHPRAEVQLICSRFSGAAYRKIVARLLPAEQAARVSFFSVVARDYNETTWWTCRSGVREFMLHWLQRIYGSTGGGDDSLGRDWDPDAYERSLARIPRGTPR